MTEPAIVITPELLELPELLAIQESAANVLEKIKACGQGTDELNFGESLWPAAIDQADIVPELVLVPLSRLGAVQGYSGNRVLIGYFADKNSSLFPSRPLVIKLSAKHGTDKLQEERGRAAAIRRYIAYFSGEFAMPMHYDAADSYGVLWSPFSSSTPPLGHLKEGSGSRLALGIEDMWYHLRKRPHSPESNKLSPADAADPARSPAKDIDAKLDRVIDLRSSITSVFELLKPLHMANGTAARKKRRVVEEYREYLRDVDAEWGDLWPDIWASKDEKDIQIQGGTRRNPFWVLARIASLELPMYCGAVHGDLHPKNILFSVHRTPHVIDFGWAACDSHVAKDFVLLECNLRFMVLRPEIPENHVEKFAKWLGFEDVPPEFDKDKDNYCRTRIDLVKHVREIARGLFPKDTDWNAEYIVPLFLVAFGLLKHLRDTDNQASAMQTVLGLAEHVSKALSLN